MKKNTRWTRGKWQLAANTSVICMDFNGLYRVVAGCDTHRCHFLSSMHKK